ncbi:Crp/Fnr family transcriptional regulator [Spirosoma sp. RP8]|uniref:Crp/Fnr family transcriptional regulator n=1 Tax=Spirosoma liriopis TaxID=2937440 RepID=A0ABT0HSV2_9BACT|nr:Crp/Fnr family transcriptional regulator [Spirosoma liriopis]MCK8494723.1 Crp/Fnr family transcriptional regulator [Spirosoma liriopis]
MINQFDHYLRSKAQFTDDELQQIHACSIPLNLRRRQLLLREGDVCRHKIFVLGGLLRTYRVRADGIESTMRFTIENGWSIDHESYVDQTPSNYRIEAMEESSVLLWTREAMDELFDEIPTFKLLSDRLREQSMNESLQRIFINISYTAEEKYDAFVNAFPDVFRRVPLHMVASYLGLSRETLSRVRHKHHRVG